MAMEEDVKYPKLVDDSYYVYEDGSRSASYDLAFEYECDWAIVKKGLFEGNYYLRHYTGVMEGPYDEIGPFKYGWAVVKKEREGKYQYRHISGVLKEDEQYALAKQYSARFDKNYPVALCRKEKDGAYYFRDANGNLSEPYLLVRPDFYGYFGIKNRGEKMHDISIDEIKKSINKNIKDFDNIL